MRDAVIYLTASRDQAARRAAVQAAEAWRGAHAASIAWCHRLSAPSRKPPFARQLVLLVHASTEALAAVPPPLTVELLALAPRRVRAAIVRDVAYDGSGTLVRGMSHFAPGTLVYVAGPFSGDGYERTMMIGRDRDTGRYVALMGPTARLKQWHLVDVTDPEALFVLRTSAGDWRYRSAFEIDLPTTRPPLVWQPPEAWGALVARWFEPERPQLAACAAAVLGCELDEVLGWVARGTLGRELSAAQKGRFRPGGREVVRSSAAAWRVLAPEAWQDDAASRAFARPDLGAPGDRTRALPTRAVPGGVHAAVVFCSAPAGIVAAEALGRELAAMLRPAGHAAPAVVWHFVRHSEVAARLQPDPPDAARGAGLLDALRALTLAIARDDDGAAHELVCALRAGAAGREDPAGPLLALIARGYALLDVADDGTPHLACPLLPAAPAHGPAPRRA